MISKLLQFAPTLFRGLKAKGAGKVGPFVAVLFLVAIAGLRVIGRDDLADAVEQVANTLGIAMPFPVASAVFVIVTLVGVWRFLASAFKRGQADRPITDVVPPDPVTGRRYFEELLWILQHDAGLTFEGAQKRARNLLEMAKQNDINPAAIVASLSEQHGRKPKLPPSA